MDKSPEAFRTISEVAEVLDTPAHVLRFWESRFPQIRPVKRAGGRRYYRPADVALLSGIRKLLHDDGITIRGVQKILREQGVRHVAGLSGQELAEEPDPEIALERALAETWPPVPERDGEAAEAAQILVLEDALRRVRGVPATASEEEADTAEIGQEGRILAPDTAEQAAIHGAEAPLVFEDGLPGLPLVHDLSEGMLYASAPDEPRMSSAPDTADFSASGADSLAGLLAAPMQQADLPFDPPSAVEEAGPARTEEATGNPAVPPAGDIGFDDAEASADTDEPVVPAIADDPVSEVVVPEGEPQAGTSQNDLPPAEPDASPQAAPEHTASAPPSRPTAPSDLPQQWMAARLRALPRRALIGERETLVALTLRLADLQARTRAAAQQPAIPSGKPVRPDEPANRD